MKKTRLAALLAVAACATGGPGQKVSTPAMIAPSLSVGATGTVEEGDVIEVGTLRPVGAVRATAAFEGPIRGYDTGHVFVASVVGDLPRDGKVGRDTPGIAWCDTDRPPTFGVQTRTCFQDENQDGRFDRAYSVVYPGSTSVFGRFPVIDTRWTATAAYEAADDASVERLAGYRVCSAEGRPRFASVIAAETGRFADAGLAPCNYGTFLDDDLFSVDAMTLRVEQATSALTYVVTEAPDAGMVALPRRGASLTPHGRAGAGSLASLTRLARFASAGLETKAPLDLSSLPAVASEGDVLLTAPVGYGSSGVLVESVTFKQDVALGWLGKRGTDLDAGTPLYAAPLTSIQQLAYAPEGLEPTWCALRYDEDDEASSLCFAPNAGGRASHFVKRGELFVTEIRGSYPPTGPAPIVRPGETPVLDGLSITVSVDDLKDDRITLRYRLTDSRGTEQDLPRRIPVVDGAVRLPLGPDTAIVATTEASGGVSLSVEGSDTVPAGVPLY